MSFQWVTKVRRQHEGTPNVLGAQCYPIPNAIAPWFLEYNGHSLSPATRVRLPPWKDEVRSISGVFGRRIRV